MIRMGVLGMGLAAAVATAGAHYWSPSPRKPAPVPVARPVPDKGLLLVAARDMIDPRFRRTVILLLEHDDSGTLGVIVNHPTGITVGKALPKIKALTTRKDPIYFGGPVGLKVVIFLFRHDSRPPESARAFGDVYFSASSVTLERILKSGNMNDQRLRVFFGHAGWAPGQLDAELERGDWHLATADAHTLFKESGDTLWRRLINRLEPEGLQTRKMPNPAGAALAGL